MTIPDVADATSAASASSRRCTSTSCARAGKMAGRAMAAAPTGAADAGGRVPAVAAAAHDDDDGARRSHGGRRRVPRRVEQRGAAVAAAAGAAAIRPIRRPPAIRRRPRPARQVRRGAAGAAGGAAAGGGAGRQARGRGRGGRRRQPQGPAQRHSTMANLACYPAINVPNGFTDGRHADQRHVLRAAVRRRRAARARQGVSGRGRPSSEETDEARRVDHAVTLHSWSSRLDMKDGEAVKPMKKRRHDGRRPARTPGVVFVGLRENDTRCLTKGGGHRGAAPS